MTPETPAQGKITNALRTAKERLSLGEMRRLAKTGREYIKTHPGTTLMASLAAGFALGYVAKMVAERRHASRRAAPSA